MLNFIRDALRIDSTDLGDLRLVSMRDRVNSIKDVNGDNFPLWPEPIGPAWDKYIIDPANVTSAPLGPWMIDRPRQESIWLNMIERSTFTDFDYSYIEPRIHPDWMEDTPLINSGRTSTNPTAREVGFRQVILTENPENDRNSWLRDAFSLRGSGVTITYKEPDTSKAWEELLCG